MRPPVETPSMKRLLFLMAKVPSKDSATFRISLLSSGLVPFISSCQLSVISCQLRVGKPDQSELGEKINSSGLLQHLALRRIGAARSDSTPSQLV